MEKEKILKKTTVLMKELGIPAHLKGYHYIREAIALTIEDPMAATSITESIYLNIANKLDTTCLKVESGIRRVIEVSWKKGNPQILDTIFGPQAQKSRRPKNSEYIAGIAEYIRYSLKE